VLQLSVRHKRNDHLWFSFFHELGHILLHSKREQFIEYDSSGQDRKEQEADHFACNTLIPRQYEAELDHLRTLSDIKDFADRIGLAPGIVVGRIQHDKIISYKVGQGLFIRYRFSE